MVKAVNHIAIAVRTIAERRDFYERVLGARFEGFEDVPSQKVRVAFFVVGEGEHAVRLELLEPTAGDSPVASFIDKRGEGLHHIAFTVDSIADQLADLARQNVRLIDHEPRPGAHGMAIGFVHPRASGGVLTELCERKR